ncbi:MAG: hypothetical protein HQL53_07385 [Magnetococcales bacterium]|nr:hypothetical protein [Magnetococcales bacterium]
MSGPVMNAMTILAKSGDELTNRRADQASRKVMDSNIQASRVSHLNFVQAKSAESSAKVSEESRFNAHSYRVTLSEEARNVDTVYTNPKVGSVYAAPQ